MPPAHLPPTPAASGEFTIKDASFQAMDTMSEHSFALPPAALSPIALDKGSSSRKGSMIAQQTPMSPASPAIDAAIDRKSGTVAARVGTKRAATTAASSSTMLDEFNLPPPPTRSRKIIQMKPKTAAPSSSNTTATKQSPPKKSALKLPSKNGSLAAASTAPLPTNINATSPTLQLSNSSNGSKRKQPSATSAAGRKIARKTAHSLIERRRRSKMNEEFATLKDMIPACRGQEMHKLAILQASIDYMNYLEDCITELKNNASAGAGRTDSISKKQKLEPPSLAPPSPTSPELVMPPMGEESVGSESGSSSPEPLPHNNASHYSSPSFSPYTAPTASHQNLQPLDNGAHPILPSPALRPLYSPQIRPETQPDSYPAQMHITNQNSSSHNHTSWRVPQQIVSATPSPAIRPQQHRQSTSSIMSASIASPIFLANDSSIDHEASAALLMLNMDRRGPSSISEQAGGDGVYDGISVSSSSSSSSSSTNKARKMGMSVRDLLTS
ncbi:hypothetical protein UA08_04587 [Talaromyces atroroseus]|uniref:BHLH domain-containing protein n=1 Tax=Talaromyces atroroseus TaxID=1441469 RepID=A0A225AXV3_TALAT|nr:hypothetical protein UA08_04587 [Talaromyces atroroseus]OKL59806.1 hypothetical protein UA08_04587 [Talaromyces atroroseus]